ncbi:N-alpha-acetyltransferase 30, NatC catalytic subunit [Gigaspora margarita]|uniref:N-alpha-acetyltransferase 30, NatC catalytic subunit n=2 Tax=Gigaspora margarita TaxID=4874 RepID=A0A8H4A5Y3_GIGMA|nr:N-alpha-acetyltransferase 30, NatC catalytic subunit [Gigaspora margarita]
MDTKTVTKNDSTWQLSVSIMKKFLFLIMFLCLILQILMVDITSGNNINSRDDQQISPHSKLTESPIQEQNLSASKNYDCVATGECTCELVGECEPCDKLDSAALDYCKQYGNREEIKCKWNGTPKNGSNLPEYRPCRRVKRLERAKYFEFQFVSAFIAFISCTILIYRRHKLTADGYRRLARRIGGNIL